MCARPAQLVVLLTISLAVGSILSTQLFECWSFSRLRFLARFARCGQRLHGQYFPQSGRRALPFLYVHDGLPLAASTGASHLHEGTHVNSVPSCHSLYPWRVRLLLFRVSVDSRLFASLQALAHDRKLGPAEVTPLPSIRSLALCLAALFTSCASFAYRSVRNRLRDGQS